MIRIRLPHVDTYKLNDKGEVERSTIEDKFKNHDRLNEKVNLDHYRSESKKIFQIIKQDYKIVEIASIDEVFIDINPEIAAFKSDPSAPSLPPLCSKILLPSVHSFPSPYQIENKDFLIAGFCKKLLFFLIPPPTPPSPPPPPPPHPQSSFPH